MAEEKKKKGQESTSQEGQVPSVGKLEMTVEAKRIEEPDWMPTVEVDIGTSYPINKLQTLINSDPLVFGKAPTYEDAVRLLYAPVFYAALVGEEGRGSKVEKMGKDYVGMGGDIVRKKKKNTTSKEGSSPALDLAFLIKRQIAWEREGLPSQVAGAAAALEAMGVPTERIKGVLPSVNNGVALLEAFGEYDAANRVRSVSINKLTQEVLTEQAYKRWNREYQASKRGM